MSNDKAEENQTKPRASNLERKPPRLVLLQVDPADPVRNQHRGKHYQQGGQSYDRRLIDAYLELSAAYDSSLWGLSLYIERLAEPEEPK